MLNEEKLIKKLASDISNLENKINNPDLYNKRTNTIRKLIDAGLLIDYSLPIILAGLCIFYASYLYGNTPFSEDIVSAKANIQIIDTSIGIYNKKISFDSEYDDEIIFQHSTGWEKNEYGIYERIVTSYKLDDVITLDNKDEILSMTKYQVENAFAIENVEKIQKNILGPEDNLYNNDMLYITYFEKDENLVGTRKENAKEIGLTNLIYLILTFFVGKKFRPITDFLIGKHIKYKLGEMKLKYKEIDNWKVEELSNILELKKANFALLEDNYEEEKDIKTYKIKRR